MEAPYAFSLSVNCNDLPSMVIISFFVVIPVLGMGERECEDRGYVTYSNSAIRGPYSFPRRMVVICARGLKQFMLTVIWYSGNGFAESRGGTKAIVL